jgi:hypothetical protein
MVQVLVYWHGIIGISGKGANWVENYDPNRTIGSIINDMSNPIYRLKESGKRIEMFKHYPRDLNKYNPNEPYWSHDTTLQEYVNAMGGFSGNYIELVYVLV